jgi:hypothetical protein
VGALEDRADVTLVEFSSEQNARKLAMIHLAGTALMTHTDVSQVIEFHDVVGRRGLRRPEEPPILLAIAEAVGRRQLRANRPGQRADTVGREVTTAILACDGRAVALLPFDICRRSVRLAQAEPRLTIADKPL